MTRIKLFWIGIMVAVLMLPMVESGQARGGGGGHSGGWSGGRGGGGGEHRGGEGERRGEGDRHWDNDRHGYYNRGDYGWGWGAADAAIAGVAIAEASQPTTVVVEQSSDSQPQQIVSGQPPLGAQVTVLPPGSAAQNVNGVVAYQCGNVWYKPFFGSSGVYYEVVPSPFTGN
ncbi:MAG: hypothetical protein WCG06_02980 [Candidatus Omnitrophota bacterium]